jgi:hypothetical protein
MSDLGIGTHGRTFAEWSESAMEDYQGSRGDAIPEFVCPPHLSEQCQNTNKAEEHSTHGFGCVGCVALRCLAGFGFGGLLRSQ